MNNSCCYHDDVCIQWAYSGTKFIMP